MNVRTFNLGQREGRTTVFVVDPANLFTVDFQPMCKGMTPAKSEPAVDSDSTGAIHADELERQPTIQRTIDQGQQFFAGDHRYRAAVGCGSIR
ncbi:hypothetical protein D3C84_983100 [compost metagenome]